MKCDKNMMLLYAVTDRSWTGIQSLYEQIESALKGGVTCVQLREKELNEKDFLAEAIEVRKLCNRYHTPFIVNDNVTIALKSNADGVHIGQNDMKPKQVRSFIGPQMLLGVSAHSVQEATDAVLSGADYLGVGAAFSTSTKHDTHVVPYELIQNISNAVSVPVVAIGGINKHNMPLLKGSHVDGVALVSAIFSSSNIEAECHSLKSLSKSIFQ